MKKMSKLSLKGRLMSKKSLCDGEAKPEIKHSDDSSHPSCSLFENIELPPPYTGLQNLGNTCFFNSVVQALRYTPGFKEGLQGLAKLVKEIEDKEDEEEPDGGCGLQVTTHMRFLHQLNKLFRSMQKVEEQYLEEFEMRSELCVHPDYLLNVLRRLKPMFEGYLQHDAQELLCCFLSIIQDGCQDVKARIEDDTDSLPTKRSISKGEFDTKGKLLGGKKPEKGVQTATSNHVPRPSSSSINNTSGKSLELRPGAAENGDAPSRRKTLGIRLKRPSNQTTLSKCGRIMNNANQTVMNCFTTSNAAKKLKIECSNGQTSVKEQKIVSSKRCNRKKSGVKIKNGSIECNSELNKARSLDMKSKGFPGKDQQTFVIKTRLPTSEVQPSKPMQEEIPVEDNQPCKPVQENPTCKPVQEDKPCNPMREDAVTVSMPVHLQLVDSMPAHLQLVDSMPAHLQLVDSMPAHLQLVERLFQGLVVLRTRCNECEKFNERKEDFQEVGLPVQKMSFGHDQNDEVPDLNPTNLSLGWALAEYTCTERLTDDNKYFCERCMHHTEAERSVLFHTLPSVLIFHLKRFSTVFSSFYPDGSVSKVNTHLATPLTLMLTPWCSKECKQRHQQYELYAIVMHSGLSSSSGHYVCYAQVPLHSLQPMSTDNNTGDASSVASKTKQQWACFDDDMVKLLSEDDILSTLCPVTNTGHSTTPYLLFYREVT